MRHGTCVFIPFLVVVSICLATFASFSLISEGSPYLPVRWIIGATFIFLAPGYSLAELVTTQLQDKIDKLQRICLTLGLNITVVTIATSILSMFWAISIFSVFLTLGTFSLFFSILAIGVRLKRDLEEHGQTMTLSSRLRIRLHGSSKLILPVSIMLVASFTFVLHPFFSNSASGFLYEFGTNSSLMDLILLAFAIPCLFYYLKTRRRFSGFLSVAILVVVLFLAVQARIYPALISFGLGNRPGVDAWDSLGHLLAVLANGKYTSTEPFILFYSNSQITAAQNPFPPGYFSLMSSAIILLSVDPISLTRAVFLFGVLQVFFIYVLVKKLTGDSVKGLLSALLIASGSCLSENIRFTNGQLSPIASIGLALIPFGLYLMTLKETQLTRFLLVLTAIGLFYIHIASAIVYVLVILIAYVGPWKLHSTSGMHVQMGNGGGKGLMLFASVVLAITAAPIAYSWLRVSLDPGASSTIHYSERFTFALPFSQGILLIPSLLDNGFFFVLLIYGIASYLRSNSPKEEKGLLFTWSLGLIGLYSFLMVTNPLISYRIFAYLFQLACVLGGCALIRDFVDKRSTTTPRAALSSILALFLIVITVFVALLPVFIRSSSPDGMYLQPVDEQKVYYNFANWAHSNLPGNCVVVVNNYTAISKTVNVLRDMGITMLVGTNLTLTDYEQISGMYANAYALNATGLGIGIDPGQVEEIYSAQQGLFWIKVYDLEMILSTS